MEHSKIAINDKGCANPSEGFSHQSNPPRGDEELKTNWLC
jgi:hypothetical protein